MRFRTLLFLLIIAAMLIIVPANEAIFRWIGLDATLRGEELRFGTGTSLTANDSNAGIDGSDAVDPCIENIQFSSSNGDSHSSSTNNQLDIRADAPPMIASRQIEINRVGRNPGDTLVSNSIAVNIEGTPEFSKSEELGDEPRIRLHQNNPNPFNSSTKISFVVPEGGEVALELFNILGQKVGEVYSGYVNAGYSEFGVDKSLHNLASGIYFYRLSFDSLSLVKKMMILK